MAVHLQKMNMQHQMQSHHSSRRRKKRSNFGIRTVEVTRGHNGFGFTISGQQPCLLSSIISNSPADVAGLRSGDYLIAVNGTGVSKVPHDDVVKLIERSGGTLRLQIAENYYSDSSDDDGRSFSMSRARSRPRCRPRSGPGNNQQNFSRAAKVVRDIQSGALFGGLPLSLSASTSSLPLMKSDNKDRGYVSPGSYMRWPKTAPPPPPLPPPPSKKRESEKIVHRAVLGYLGSIDIPRNLQNISMNSLVKKCIKRIKMERRNPTTVLLTIHVTKIKLNNTLGNLIAEYPSHRVLYCNSLLDDDKLHFGILTKTAIDEANNIITNSCHVFKVQTKLIEHSVHLKSQAIFGFLCTRASEYNGCQEFPSSCEEIISAIQALYIKDTREQMIFEDSKKIRNLPSPQPSMLSTSTVHSSNSDSGICFKDDSGNFSDRCIAVSSLERNPKKPYESKLTVLNMDQKWNDFSRPLPKKQLDFNASTNQNGAHSEKRYSIGDYIEIYDVKNENSYNYYDKINATANSSYEGCQNSNSSNGDFGGGASSVVSCPCVPSARYSKSSSPSTLAALSRSPRRYYTSTLSVGTLGEKKYLHNKNNQHYHNHHYHSYNKLNSSDNLLKKTYSQKIGMNSPTELNKIPIPERLSPKVYLGFNGNHQRGCSMENLGNNNNEEKKLNNIHDTAKSLSYDDGPKTPNRTPTRAWGSMQEIRKVDPMLGSSECCDKESVVGIASWSLSFEKLLTDPKGLQTFAKYLKKEISHENIYFWAACERYLDTEDQNERKILAKQIYDRHLSNNALEPVNVDSKATSQINQETLNSAPKNLFALAQKQIFNLMKFDSYPRFLRSEIYRKCVETGECPEDGTPDDGELVLKNSPSIKLKKSHSDAEDRRRKSILPWHRKNRSKSKDRGELEYKKTSRGETMYKSLTSMKKDNDGNTDDESTSVSSSRSSLASWDLALRQSFTKHSASSCEGQSNEKREANVSNKCTGLCRVILPDGSTTVIPTTQSETVRDVVTRLLEKRALHYSNYDVLMLATDEIINLKHSSSVLASQEVEIVPSKIIKVDLPSRRVISIVAHKGKTLKEVLKPLLNKYGFKLDLISVWSDGHPISLDILAANAPLKLTITSNKEMDDSHIFKVPDELPRGQSTLDEITNKVFEELRVGKSTTYHSEGSCKSDDQRSESSSTLSGKLFSKDSSLHIKKRSKFKHSSSSEKGTSNRIHQSSSRSHPPLIAKWRNGVKLQLPNRFEGDGVFEGLKKAQKARLEDQRGTEINIELPDFLKNKENNLERKNNRKMRGGFDNSEVSKFYDSEEDKPILERCFDNSDTLEKTIIEAEKTIIENGSFINNTESCDHNSFQDLSPRCLKPPPLPPKPKNLANTMRNNALPSRPFQTIVYDKKTL